MIKTLAIKEGEPLPDGRTLAHGALHMGDEQRVPITYALDGNNFQPLGWASNIERKSELITTEVSFDMIMREDDFQLDLYGAYPFCTDLEERKVDLSDEGLNPEMLVMKARVRCIQLVPIPGIMFANKPKPLDV